MRQQLKLWDSKRERERETKLTGQNTLPAFRRTKGLSNSREELANGGPAHPPLEAGGRREGKGENSAPEMGPQTANPLPNCKQAPNLPSGRVAARGQLLRTVTGVRTRLGHEHAETEAGTAEGRRRTWGECASKAPGCLSCSSWGRQKTQAQPSPRFLWNTQKLEPHPMQGPLHIEQPRV